MGKGPLEGCFVVDLSHHMAGPVASQRLGDLGAEVIKIEPTGFGEWTRVRPIGNGWVGKLNTSYIACNRNKRSLSLNIKTARGMEVLRKLVEKADVFLVNFRPEVAKRLGIDYPSLKKINNALVYCSVTGFGEDGPYENRPGQDLLVQALAGAAWSSGRKSDPPIPLGTFVADASAGMNAALGIVAALYHREKTGEGQKISVNLMHSLMDIQIQEYTTVLNSTQKIERREELHAHPLINSPYGIHRTKDGYIALSMAPFDKLADALDCPELLRFKKWEDGQVYRDEIFRITATALLKKTTGEWLAHLDTLDVWCAPVKTHEEVLKDPQVLHSEIIQEITHPQYGSMKIVANPIQMSGTPAQYRSAPPGLGEHNAVVLRELGYTDEEIGDMNAKGIIQNEEPDTYRI